MQHLLILLDWEVSDGGECTDVVHAETAGRALGAMEERSMCGGHRPQWNTLIASNLGWVFDGYETYALVISVGVALRQTRGKPLPE